MPNILLDKSKQCNKTYYESVTGEILCKQCGDTDYLHINKEEFDSSDLEDVPTYCNHCDEYINGAY